ncbi:MAG: hypothetical protein GEU92_21520, partial [Alphaproteobacteria bacterium]|nr:hypothetical protein [Alphaproteobacteria bacterium]
MTGRNTTAAEVLDAELRPRIQAHGGDVRVERDEFGVLQLRFSGACQACPALAMTFFGVVRPRLLAADPGVTEVRCDQVSVSEHARRRLESLWNHQA